ncbi:MAG: hypothetical protein HY775_11225 [Acidobacteria bacterium]|nr:hypothetical protein [Acidobacteriota bacterium]
MIGRAPRRATSRKPASSNIDRSPNYPSLAEGTAVPYGAYDVARNQGFVSVGRSADTAEFAVEAIRRWWRLAGRRHCPKALTASRW